MITQFINVLSTLFVINTTSTNTYSSSNSSHHNSSLHNSSHHNSSHQNISNSICPTISSMTYFNTTEYIRSSWYIQQQQITTYQPNNTLYCVMQTLNSSSRTVPFFSGAVLDVYNYGNFGSVNGEQQNKMNFTLCARQFNQSIVLLDYGKKK